MLHETCLPWFSTHRSVEEYKLAENIHLVVSNTVSCFTRSRKVVILEVLYQRCSYWPSLTLRTLICRKYCLHQLSRLTLPRLFRLRVVLKQSCRHFVLRILRREMIYWKFLINIVTGILYWEFLLKSFDQIQDCLKLYINTGHFTWRPTYIFEICLYNGNSVFSVRYELKFK